MTTQTATSYPHPYVTVDIVLFTIRYNALQLLLVKRKNVPYQGMWALPGGFVDENEPLAHAARRELREETGLTPAYLVQVHAFGRPGRDPRGHTISIAYAGLLPIVESKHTVAGDDAASAQWWPVNQLPLLAFDHSEIVHCLRTYVQKEVRQHMVLLLNLLPKEFSLTEAQYSYEALLGQNVDRRNFRRQIMTSSLLEEIGQRKPVGRGRPARIFSLAADKLPESPEDRC